MTDSDASPILPSPFTRYQPSGRCYDEFLTSAGEVQPRWKPVLEHFPQFTAREMNVRIGQANHLVRENGVSYNVHRTSEEDQRPWSLDILPVVFSPEEWQELEAGLNQRAKLLNLILKDLYGPQRLLKERILPAQLVYGNSQFFRPFCHLLPPEADHMLLYGAELARSPLDGWRVMADRSTAPRGPGYALENRIIVSRFLPHVVTDSHVRRLASFFQSMQSHLGRLAPRNQENPYVVLLTPGPESPFYFEDAYLARYLGYPLVECEDLTVRDQHVWLKTLSGLTPVDVIFRRVNDLSIDPLELGAWSGQGIPGLLQAVRERKVAVVNPPGSGFVEAPVLMARLPECCLFLLNEPLRLPSIATWWCGDTRSAAPWQDKFAEMVIKPAFKRSGSEEILVSELTPSEREKLREKIKQNPAEYLAQEKIRRSSTPTWIDGKVQPAHIALRLYALGSGGHYETMPGGLARVASTPGPIELSIGAGDFSKDVWVLSTKKEPQVTLLPGLDRAIALRRSGPDLPSRVADNLFWLGRQLRRAECTARLLRETIRRLAGESEIENLPELPGCLRALAAVGQVDARDVIEEFGTKVSAVQSSLPLTVLSPDEGMSLRQTVARLYHAASTVRDRLSMDTWRVISSIHEDVSNDLQNKTMDLNGLWDLMEWLIRELTAVMGHISGGMIRGPAWRFLDLGLRTEKAHQILFLLNSTLVTASEENTNLIQAILEVSDVILTYRSRYLARFHPVPVLDLLLADETNPGSLASQLLVISQHVALLPRPATAAVRSPEQLAMLNAVHLVQTSDIADLARANARGRAAGLERFLKQMEHQLNQCTHHITQHYLLHAGPPRQFPEA